MRCYILAALCLTVLVFSSCLATTAANEPPCQSPIGPRGTCYWLASQTVPNQRSAIDQCAIYDGQLAGVTSPSVQAFLRKHIDFSHLRLV